MGLNNWQEFFEGKKVTQMGLGLLGRGLLDAKFLAENVSSLTVTDKKTEAELAKSVKALAKFENIKFVLGGHRLDDFENCDFILKGAGIPNDSQYIAHAKSKNIPIFMDEALFSKLAPSVSQIGVTGTRGKSTTTMLIHHIVSHAYNGHNNNGHDNNNQNKNVFLGGNIKEVATLPFLQHAKDSDVLVAELSSWQLQGYADVKISPTIAVFTNILPDHLNYYKNNFELYFRDKAGIYLNQKTDDHFICTQNVLDAMEKYSLPAPSKVTVVSEVGFEKFIETSPLVGKHNALNIACAVCACRAFGISDDLILEAVQTFEGAPGRLQKIKEQNGIVIYNDTNSTTPESLIAGLSGLGEKFNRGDDKKIVLIMGGADKGLDYSDLYEVLSGHAKAIITTPGSGTDLIFDKLFELSQNTGLPLVRASSTAEAVELSTAHLKEGDILLFSPGFASFSEFKNEYDRGEQFEELIERIFEK